MTIKVSISKRKTRAGGVKLRVRGWVGGERTSFGAFDTKAEAKLAKREAEDLHQHDTSLLTFGAWGEQCLTRREKSGHHRSAANDRSRWALHVAGTDLAGMLLRKVRRGEVLAWLDEMLTKDAMSTRTAKDGTVTRTPSGRKLSPATTKHVLNLVQRFLQDAVDREKIAGHPARGVKVPKPKRTEEPWRWMTVAEIDRVLGLPDVPRGRERPSPQEPALHPAQRSAITVAIFTGLRAGELWGLRWMDVTLDGPKPELHVRHSFTGPPKSGEPRHVPLLAPARAALRAWFKLAPGVGKALVWPAEGTRRRDGVNGSCHAEGFDAGWERVVRYARIRPELRFHDCRHTCASHLVQGTWTPTPLRLEDVRQWLGHESIRTTERYARFAPGGLHDAVREPKARKR